jgi:hypothetical protein
MMDISDFFQALGEAADASETVDNLDPEPGKVGGNALELAVLRQVTAALRLVEMCDLYAEDIRGALLEMAREAGQ